MANKRKCRVCGGPLSSCARCGICSRNDACVHERDRQRNRERRKSPSYVALCRERYKQYYRRRFWKGCAQRRPWSKREEQILAKEHGRLSYAEIGRLIDRSVRACEERVRLKNLGKRCRVCGVVLKSTNRIGVCNQNDRCKREATRVHGVRARQRRPEYIREYNRRPEVRTRRREHERAHRFRTGPGGHSTYLPRRLLRGPNHPCWSGGKLCRCVFPGCGELARYAGPAQIRKQHGRFYCEAHSNYWYAIRDKGAKADEKAIKENLAFVH